MKKLITLLTAFLISVGCSHTPLPSSTVDEKAKDYPSKSVPDLKIIMNKLVDQHNELDEQKRIQLKEILGKGLEKSLELRQQESRLVQVYFDDILVRQVSKKELSLVKKEIKRTLELKIENFLNTFDEVNKILGRNEVNAPISRDFMDTYRDMK